MGVVVKKLEGIWIWDLWGKECFVNWEYKIFYSYEMGILFLIWVLIMVVLVWFFVLDFLEFLFLFGIEDF